MPKIVRKGDDTDHGGVVLEGFEHTHLNGNPIAGVGHQVSCPRCKGVYAIAEGSRLYGIDGTPIALDGMQTTCGARLIASNSKANVSH